MQFNADSVVKVFRIPPVETTAIYWVAVNPSLSFTAKGVFAYLRFSPEPVTLAQLMRLCIASGLTPRGIEQVSKELLEGGFVQLTDAIAE